MKLQELIRLIFSGMRFHGTACLKLSYRLDRTLELAEDTIKKLFDLLFILLLVLLLTLSSADEKSMLPSTPLTLLSLLRPPRLHDELKLKPSLLSSGLQNDLPPLDENERPILKGSSSTVVGEGILVTLLVPIFINLGGGTKHLTALDLGSALLLPLVVTSAALVLGFPGASSHSKGIEAKLRIGGVGISSGSLFLLGKLYELSFGVKLGSFFSSSLCSFFSNFNPISLY